MVHRPKHSVSALAGIATASLLLAGCGGGGATVHGVHIVSKGKLTTCTHMPYQPFEYQKGSKDVGFDIDLVGLVAHKLGVKQQVVDTPFETIKTGSALNAGKCDIAAAGMTITPQRKKKLDFSKPYIDASQALLTRKGKHYSSIGAVHAAHLKVGSESSTTGEDYARAHGIDTRSYKDSVSLLNGLRTKQVDAIILDSPVLESWLKSPKNSAFAVAANFHTGEKYGLAVKKGGNAKLLSTINSVLAKAQKDGSYAKIYRKWIGPNPKPIG